MDNDRLVRLITAFGYLKDMGKAHKQQDVAEKIGTDKSNISRAFNGDDKYLTDRFLHRFNAAYDGIFNEDWLLTGQGDMLRPVQSVGDKNGGTIVGANVSGNGNNISNNDANSLLLAIKEVSEMRKLFQEQVKNNQEQFDRFMSIIEKLALK